MKTAYIFSPKGEGEWERDTRLVVGEHLKDAVQELGQQLIEEKGYSGYENDEGAGGCLEIDVVARILRYSHYETIEGAAAEQNEINSEERLHNSWCDLELTLVHSSNSS